MSERDGVTIVYATHIFDGLDEWPTHLAFVAENTLARFGTVHSFPDFVERLTKGTTAPLLRTIENWMRAQRAAQKAKGISLLEKAGGMQVDELRGAVTGNGYLSGRIGSALGHN